MKPTLTPTHPPTRPAATTTRTSASRGLFAAFRPATAGAGLLALAVLGPLTTGRAQLVGGSYQLLGQSTGGGGRSLGGTWELAGSIAVPVCAVSVGGSYVLNGGLVGAWTLPPVTSTVQIERAAADVRIQFTGTLQSAPSITGPWTDVESASSPHTVGPVEAARFFRSRQ